MEDHNLLLHLIALAVLIGLSAFFSGTETALMALNKLKLKHQAREGSRIARVLEKILSRPESLIGTILLGNNLVNVASSALATSIAISLWGEEMGILYATFIMTLVLLIFAEVTPKTYAAYHSEGVANLVARPLSLLMKVMKPLVYIVTLLSGALLAILGVKRKKKGVLFTEDELKTMILLGEEAGILEEKKTEMLQGILELREYSVRDVMVPRMDIYALNLDDPDEAIKARILASPFSRIPVYRGNIEKVEGVLLVKDYLKALASGETPDMEKLVSPPYFIPESKKIQEQLTDFQRKRMHLAVILDEFGGIEGIVTMEDLLEEIVGEIWDESDTHLTQIARNRDGSVMVEGRLTIRDLNRYFDVELPEEEYNTVAGLLLHELGRIPERGDRLTFMGLDFTAVSVVGQAVKKVKVQAVHVPAEGL